MDKILIINTGGTFNKRYNPLKGELEVPRDSNAIDNILQYYYNLNYDLKNIIHKDSLDITNDDRVEIGQLIKNSSHKKILIIHGTDTIDKTAQFLDENISEKMILLTGAMVPYSIDTIEANANFSMSLGHLLSCFNSGVFISIHGAIDIYKNIYKDRKVGIFKTK